MSLRKPTKRDLSIGNIVDIYDGEGAFKGKAKLLQRKPSRFLSDDLPYLKFEKKNDTQQPTGYYWSSERFLVEWVSHDYFRPGDKNCVMVHFFVKMCTDMDSKFDYNKDINHNGEVGGLFVFIEESILEADGGAYTPNTVKALKRVMRAGNGALVLYTHSPLLVKERFELSKLPFRIFDFINTDVGFQEGIENYLEGVDFDEYLIFTGESNVMLPNTIKCHNGLRLKNEKKGTIL